MRALLIQEITVVEDNIACSSVFCICVITDIQPKSLTALFNLSIVALSLHVSVHLTKDAAYIQEITVVTGHHRNALACSVFASLQISTLSL